MTDIFLSVQGIIANLLQIEEDMIVPDAQLIEDLGADSLDRFQLLLKAQEEFGIVISEMEAMEVYSVADAITLIEQKMLDNQQKTS